MRLSDHYIAQCLRIVAETGLVILTDSYKVTDKGCEFMALYE